MQSLTITNVSVFIFIRSIGYRSRVQQSDNSCDKQLVAIDHDYHDYEKKKTTTFFLSSLFLISIIIVTPILMFSYLNRIYILRMIKEVYL